MRRGRNDPCLCGSGKKYKRCCLQKDELEARPEAQAAKTPHFDPRDLISGPYQRCPICQEEQLGILLIAGTNCIRRCRQCGQDQNLPLPSLEKTIIYLDQNVISEIEKLLDPAFPRQAKVQPVWLDLFKKLDRLLKLQLIVCPESHFHHKESLLTHETAFKSLQDIYGYFSNGCVFSDDASILRRQVSAHFRSYLRGIYDKEQDRSASDIVHGNLNAWTDRAKITIPQRFDSTEADSFAVQRRSQQTKLADVFSRWQQGRESYSETVKEEALALGNAILATFNQYVEKSIRVKLEVENFESPLDLLPLPSVCLVHELIKIVEERIPMDPIETLVTVTKYFQSEHFLKVPFVRLTSMLYAAIARKARAGRLKPPNEGTVTDISAISSLLPYCSVMFLDNEMAGYLMEEPLRGAVGEYGARIFSLNTMADFLNYLDDLENRMPPQHLQFVDLVYGDTWREPFVSIVKKRRESRLRRS